MMMDTPSPNLFVAGLSPQVDDSTLMELFRPFGDILSAKVMLDIHTGVSRGFGFVLFSDVTCATKAMDALEGTITRNSRLHIRYSQHRGENLLMKIPNIYVRNIPFSLTEEQLMEHFLKFGKILLHTLKPDTTPGSLHSTNVLYLEFERYEDAQTAMEKTHNSAPFSQCQVPLLAKMAEPPHLRSERKARIRAERHNVPSQPPPSYPGPGCAAPAGAYFAPGTIIISPLPFVADGNANMAAPNNNSNCVPSFASVIPVMIVPNTQGSSTTPPLTPSFTQQQSHTSLLAWA